MWNYIRGAVYENYRNKEHANKAFYNIFAYVDKSPLALAIKDVVDTKYVTTRIRYLMALASHLRNSYPGNSSTIIIARVVVASK